LQPGHHWNVAKLFDAPLRRGRRPYSGKKWVELLTGPEV